MKYTWDRDATEPIAKWLWECCAQPAGTGSLRRQKLRAAVGMPPAVSLRPGRHREYERLGSYLWLGPTTGCGRDQRSFSRRRVRHEKRTSGKRDQRGAKCTRQTSLRNGHSVSCCFTVLTTLRRRWMAPRRSPRAATKVLVAGPSNANRARGDFVSSGH